jgi:2,3-bisphosphoglycerate-dependent phosphoglycerate mutase
MRCYLVRHAQSTNNALSSLANRDVDPPLTDLGQRQAKLVAAHLAFGSEPQPRQPDRDDRPGYGITRLYCSPMWRSLQTAQPIGQALGLTPEVMIDIHEQGGLYLDHGEAGGLVGYPGKSRREILADFPDYLLPKAITDGGWWSGGCEDEANCYDRARKVAGQLYEWAETEERIAFVSHGAFIDVLLKTLLIQAPTDRFYFTHYNTAITRLDVRPERGIFAHYSNSIAHLPAGLISA